MDFIQNSDPIEITLQASAEGELLVFRNAKLVRQEVNANDDEIPASELDNLAATIGGRAVDVEHDYARNCGAFTAGRVVTDEIGPVLVVDGFLWMDRYPKEVQGVMKGSHKLSVEASAERATCSVCGQSFTGADDYCQHLQARKRFKAVRRVEGLKARGGAVTERPAGRGTTFDRQQLFLVASHADPIIEEETMVKCPHCQADVEASDTCAKCSKAISPALLAQQLRELETQLATATGQKETFAAEVTTLTASLTAAQEAQAAAIAAKTEAETKAAEAEARAVQALEAQRQQALGLNDADWSEKKGTIMSMNAEAFALFASVAKPRGAQELRSSVFVPDQSRNGDKPKIVLAA